MNNVEILNSFNELLLGAFFKQAVLPAINYFYNINQINYDWLNAVFFSCQGIIFQKGFVDFNIQNVYKLVRIDEQIRELTKKKFYYKTVNQ